MPRRLIEDDRTNAAATWLLVAVLVASAGESLFDAEYLWATFALTAAGIAAVPPATARDPTVVVAWEVLALATLPAFARLVDYGVAPLSYLAVVALGVLVAAEIEAFSSAAYPSWFAAAMVTLTTMASAAGWTISRWAMDSFVGTEYLTTVNTLMWELILATAIGIVGGIGFDLLYRATGGASRGE